jgi:fatty-acyl-CoA synthase
MGSPVAETGLAVHRGGTIGQIVISALARHPHRVAFSAPQREYSYAETAQRIGWAKAALAHAGLTHGDTLVQLTKNHPEHWFVAMAVFMSGMRSVALHALGSVDDHAHIINDSAAQVVIVDAAFVGRLPELRARCPQVRGWFCHSSGTELDCIWDDATRQVATPLACDAQPDDIVRLAYTGGTTGAPKGVMLSSQSLASTALLSLAEWELPRDPRILCASPISHGAGSLIVPTLARGGTIFLHAGFDADAFMDAVENDRITGFFGVPTMLCALLDHPRCRHVDWSRLEFILYGGSPMPAARIAEAIAMFGPVLNQAYGQTEAPSCITLLHKSDHLSNVAGRLKSCGQPYPGISVAILDEQCQPVPAGAIGELCVRGPHVMSGYWNQPDQTAAALAGGWLHTGDLGYQDEDNYFYLVDRQKDMIITGGFNVYPAEVEAALAAHPAVASAVVIGLADAKWGEAVTAFVILRKDVAVDEPELAGFVRAAKGPINTPKSIRFVDSVPLTALGKPDKKLMRAIYADDHARPALATATETARG